MVTLDDRLLGEKLQNYCSSSEEDDDDPDSGDEKPAKSRSKFTRESDIIPPSSSNGFTENTGPKGVIKDWQRFKQLEIEQRDEQEREKRVLLKKLSMTCRSHLYEEADKKKAEVEEEEFFDAEDDFFKEYRAKLMYQMQQRFTNAPHFGKQIDLTRDNFTSAIDNENKSVTILVHVYEPNVAGCKTMNLCFETLVEQYPLVKFCRIQASDAQLSRNFIQSGCPSILVYRGGELLASFISLTTKLGDDFVSSDVESLLQEAGFLSSIECVKNDTIRETNEKSQSDSDVE